MAGSQSSESGGFSKQQVYGKQEPFLFHLYKQGQNLYEDQKFKTADTQRALQGILDQVANIDTSAPRGAAALGRSLQRGEGEAFDAYRKLMNPQQNPYLQSMVNAATRGVAENFNENIIPGIRTNAAGVGQYGSSRQGIAEGLAARGAANAMSDIATNLYGGQYQSDMNRALEAANAFTGAQQAGAGITSSLRGQEFNQQMNQLSTLLGGTAQLPQVPWAPLAQYARILGGPTVLTEQLNRSQGSQFNIL